MKNIIKNKIALFIILFLTVFSFSNKASADEAGCLVNTTTPCYTITTKYITGTVIVFGVTVKNIPTDISLVLKANLSTFENDILNPVKNETQNLTSTPSQQTVNLLASTPVIANTKYSLLISLQHEKTGEATIEYQNSVLRFTAVANGSATVFKEDVGVTQPVIISPGVNSTADTGTYKLLAPLPGIGDSIPTDQPGAFQNYLSIIFALLIGIAGVLAVIMIVIGGIEYMSTDAIQGKEEGKEKTTQAILGLLLALGAWVILNTINPNILSLRFGLNSTSITDDSGADIPTSGAGNGIITSALCSNQSALAAKSNVPYPAQKSPELVSFITCMVNKTGKPITDSSFYGEITTIGKSDPICNYTRGDPICGKCIHAVNSCHYGGATGTQGSQAIDFGNEANWQALKTAAGQCGYKRFDCEGTGGIVSCVTQLSQANHVHVTTTGCDKS